MQNRLIKKLTSKLEQADMSKILAGHLSGRVSHASPPTFLHINRDTNHLVKSE
ncbi:hypothetical protein [Nostoc sp. TCL26-01]|uniref:hypothetical protein n=1 Tax=Nostoc sp. TCL26-01 TaxID=2576904 RepID=UPI0015BFF905|nr:hypothetical protein [Nostoc sp. TCL26-01]